MLFDIRDEDRAIHSLSCFTEVDKEYWIQEREKNHCRIDYMNVDEDILCVIESHGGRMPELREFELVLTHVTTSNNSCYSIFKHGLLDLKQAYKCEDSELRSFLVINDIEIDIDSCSLRHGQTYYDISFGKNPMDTGSIEYAAWSVGTKLYYDFAVCGFLSLGQRDVYAGNVHKCPEILINIDNLLKTELCDEWGKAHQAYEVVFKVATDETIEVDDYTEHDAVMMYLRRAYLCASTGPDTIPIVCRDGVVINPESILDCKQFDLWR